MKTNEISYYHVDFERGAGYTMVYLYLGTPNEPLGLIDSISVSGCADGLGLLLDRNVAALDGRRRWYADPVEGRAARRAADEWE